MKSPSSLPLLFFFSAGIIAGLFTFLFFVSLMTIDTLSSLLAKHGNTLAALATFAAVVVAWVVHLQQIEYQENRAEITRIKKNDALRAHMHSAVIDLMRYTEQCFIHIHSDQTDAVPPVPPATAVQLLSNSIEFSDDTSSASFRDIVSSLQVFGSRLESGQNTLSDLERTLLAVHLQIENILHYARHDVDTLEIIPRSLSSLQKSLLSITRRINPQYGTLYQQASERLNNYYGRNN